jgi:large subunit ribosomal protein L7/L12
MAKISQVDLISSIEEMSVLELNELVKALEDKFGVVAAAPVAAAAAAPGEAAGADAAEEQTSFAVVLSSSGANKIAVIKAVREINQSLGLKEAKDLVDAAPKTIAEGLNKEDSQKAKDKLTEAGATVELK